MTLRMPALVLATFASTLAGSGGSGGSASHAPAASALASLDVLPRTPAPAVRVPRPRPLANARFRSQWTVLRTRTSARAGPNPHSAAVATLSASTPEETPTALPVLRTRLGANRRIWVQVRLPILPNGSVGWVPRSALGPYQSVTTHLVIDRRRERATLYRNGKPVFAAPVGIGRPSSPTPRGQFIVRNELVQYSNRFYGPVAFGTSARSPVLTDWPAGGFVGIHGTSDPSTIPGRVSHGCIRMRNPDILRLAALLPIGTPLTIR